MPNPIPEWDYFRVILSYMIKKQLDYRPPTLKMLSLRVGIGADKILQVLDEHNVQYEEIKRTVKDKLAGRELLLVSIPPQLEELFSVDNKAIQETYQELKKREIELEPEPDYYYERWLKKEKLKKLQMRYFLAEEIPEGEGT
jgi:hypothetical protein